MKPGPDYGINAPGVIRAFALVASLFLLASALIATIPGLAPWRWLALVCLLPGLLALAFGTAMVAYEWRGKYRQRDLMISRLKWRGDEQVLDVGTGRGLLAIGAAQRLTSGRVTGIDIWQAKDLSGNRPEKARANAELEGVSSRVDFITESVCAMSFPDASFDTILSLLCLHNIESAAERQKAIREIARVLKPGGTLLLADYIPTHGYATALAAAGLSVASSRRYFSTAYALMWMVEAGKPAKGSV